MHCFIVSICSISEKAFSVDTNLWYIHLNKKLSYCRENAHLTLNTKFVYLPRPSTISVVQTPLVKTDRTSWIYISHVLVDKAFVLGNLSEYRH